MTYFEVKQPECPEGFKWNPEALRCEPDKGKRAKAPRVPRGRRHGHGHPVVFVVKGDDKTGMDMMPEPMPPMAPDGGGEVMGMEAKKVIDQILSGTPLITAVSEALDETIHPTVVMMLRDAGFAMDADDDEFVDRLSTTGGDRAEILDILRGRGFPDDMVDDFAGELSKAFGEGQKHEDDDEKLVQLVNRLIDQGMTPADIMENLRTLGLDEDESFRIIDLAVGRSEQYGGGGKKKKKKRSERTISKKGDLELVTSEPEGAFIIERGGEEIDVFFGADDAIFRWEDLTGERLGLSDLGVEEQYGAAPKKKKKKKRGEFIPPGPSPARLTATVTPSDLQQAGVSDIEDLAARIEMELDERDVPNDITVVGQSIEVATDRENVAGVEMFLRDELGLADVR